MSLVGSEKQVSCTMTDQIANEYVEVMVLSPTYKAFETVWLKYGN
jgi:hypothetical protein